jgi:YVTN family beta-propeller protein
MVPSCARLARYLLIAVVAAGALPAVAGARQAYVSNHGDGTVTPIDVATGTAGTPIFTPIPRGIAIAPDGSTAYVANQWNTVTPLDLETGVPGLPIPVGDQPVAIAMTPDGATAYVANLVSGNVTPIDVTTGTAGTPIAVGGAPEGIAVTPDGATAYVANGNTASVTPIDTATGTAGTPIPVGPFPYGIAVTPDGATAYVPNGGSDDVTPIATATNTPGAPIPVGDGPRTVAITPDGATAYVVNDESDDVTPIATATNTPGTPIPVGDFPTAIAISPDGATAYVTNADSNDVTPIDTATNTAQTPIAVGTSPWAVALTPNQAPGAEFGATPAAPGSATSFDASGSTDSDGAVASYAWDFGDGHSETTADPTASHTYSEPGTYTVTLTVTDNEGCSTDLVFTGQTASCNGSGSAHVQHQVIVPVASTETPADPSPSADPAAPAQTAEPRQAIERFALASRCVRPSRAGIARVKLNLRLVRRGRVRVQVQRAVGSGAMKSCPKPSRSRRFEGRLRHVEVHRSMKPRVVAAAVAGRMTLRMRLRPGLYRITVHAYDSDRELSQPARRWLRVLG